MKKLEDPFSFPHYWFDVIFLFTYVPTNIVFDYFVQDWAYTGRIFCRTSMTAFLILEAVCFLQLYLFRYKLKGYLLPEHEELYAWLTRKKDNPLTILPFVLCKKTLKWRNRKIHGCNRFAGRFCSLETRRGLCLQSGCRYSRS